MKRRNKNIMNNYTHHLRDESHNHDFQWCALNHEYQRDPNKEKEEEEKSKLTKLAKSIASETTSHISPPNSLLEKTLHIYTGAITPSTLLVLEQLAATSHEGEQQHATNHSMTLYGNPPADETVHYGWGKYYDLKRME